ncbi:MAG: hypothetical protein IJP26_05145 [Clostridia bacterium]|nr:hypothetical protein [Clostridia bacterium]
MTVENLKDTTPQVEADIIGEAECDLPLQPNKENDFTAVTDLEQGGKFTIRYNHKDICLTEEEAKRLAQTGMHFENLGNGYKQDLKAIMAKLDVCAKQNNKSILEVIDGIIDHDAENYRAELVKKLGEDDPLVDEIMQMRNFKNSQQNTFSNKSHGAEPNEIYEQFKNIAHKFPEINDLEDLPEGVINEALDSGDLEKEILRFLLSEERKIELAKENQNTNQKQMVGALEGRPTENALFSAIMRGIWGSN